MPRNLVAGQGRSTQREGYKVKVAESGVKGRQMAAISLKLLLSPFSETWIPLTYLSSYMIQDVAE